jgi:nitroreductase
MESADDSNRLHPLLGERYSPLDFDPACSLEDPELTLLLEAARWAPSAGNSQPWAFVIGRRDDPTHGLLTRHLAASARRWASPASALVVNVAHRHVGDTDLAYSEFADYDLGQAVAHMTLQAQAMGLACRQFRAFDLPALTAELGLKAGWEVVSMTAVGLPASLDVPPRGRRALDALLSDALASDRLPPGFAAS